MYVIHDHPDELGLEPQRRAIRFAQIAAAAIAICACAVVSASALPTKSQSLTRSVDVAATPDAVWAAIGPFCAIKEWHPAIGACTQDGKTPPTRTLVTKDGKATFVELQTARNDGVHSYSYTFTSAPVPVTRYASTLKVTAKSPGVSTITWSGSYLPDAGLEHDAAEALTGIYESGLDAIAKRFGG